MKTHNYNIKRIEHRELSAKTDTVVIEAPLQIDINNTSYTVVMRTPGDDIDLVRGLLFAEDIYKSKENFDLTYLESKVKNHDVVNVNINENVLGKGYLNKRTLLSVSSCGICGKQDLESIEIDGDKLKNTFVLDATSIEYWFYEMQSRQEVFKQTGGLHAMMILNKKQEVLVIKEDIGRHNALDKAVGHLLNSGKLKEAQVLFVSGRVSYEIISKAFFAKISIVIAVSACSSLAIDFAKEFGICLIGFARNGKASVYANPHLVKV